MSKQFEFADFVDEFRVSFEVITEAAGQYATNGQWIDGAETRAQHDGIILPLSEDELRRADNGQYTERDRKVYTTRELQNGAVIEYKEKRFTINRAKDYSDYSDIFIYYAKGAGK